MSGARKRSSINAATGQKYFYVVITVITFMGYSTEKTAIASEDGKITGYYCESDPRCLCFSARNQRNYAIVCEDKVLLRRRVGAGMPVHYEMECMGETVVDSYNYLSIILFANFSAPSYMNTTGARLDVTNCSATSSNNQSVPLGDGSSGTIGGWRDLPLEKITIRCKESKKSYLSKRNLSGLKELKELRLICPKMSYLEDDFLSGSSQRLERLEITVTELRDVPERFFADMEMIRWLDLPRNKLRSFQSNFLSSMRNIETLILRENEIESLADDIFLQTEKLISLDLEKNLLTTLPTSVCHLRNLKYLLLGYNRIIFIPQDCLHSLPSLSRINLNGNKLVTMGLALERPTQIYNEGLSSDETFTKSSSMLEHSENLNNAWIGWYSIEDLYLENNSLSSLPHESFYVMDGLKILNISSNNIMNLAENMFSRNKNLKKLLASNNILTNVSATLLRNNAELNTVDLSHNLIETLDLEFFSNSSSLCFIYLSNNRIRHLPDRIFQPFLARHARCNEFVLDMNRNRLEDLPLLSLPLLTHLRLSENKLTLIKSDLLSQTPLLREVNLSHNLIHTIAMPLRPDKDNILFSDRLSELKVIDLSSNRLTVCPSISPVVTTLTHLNLSGNYFTEFEFKPERRRTWSNDLALETFDVSRNRLESVEFFDHRLWRSWKTKHVDLSHNRINLGECNEYMHSARLVWGCFSPIGGLVALEVIILSHNQIAYIPMEFQHYLPNLRFVDLSHNNITRLWHGDLLFTRARENMDLQMFWRGYMSAFSPEAFTYRYTGSNNLTIDLRHNSIASLQLSDDKIEVVIPGCDIGSQFSRVKLLLGHNPFVCDCEVFKLLRYASLEMRPTSALERLYGHRLVVPAVIDIQDLRCSKPESVKGKAVAEVDSWAYHWLPMMGLCWNDAGVEPLSGHTATNTTEMEAVVDPPT